MHATLDTAMNAPLHPAAREALLAALDEGWADPRRLSSEGRRARLLLDGAREAIAAVIGARTGEVSFAGSHVAAVHVAVGGVLRARRRTGDEVVASAVEHSAVLNAARFAGSAALQPVDRLGRVDAAGFAAALARPGVGLAALQSANGEVGTTQPVAEVAEAARAAGVPLLVDAAASLGHVAPPAAWDLLTADAHAWGGPAGIGVLALRAGTRWLPVAPEHDGLELVPGDVSVPGALSAAVALEAMTAERAANDVHRRALVDRVRAVAARVPDTEVAGDPVDRLPHVVTFSCLYVDGEAVLGELDRAGFGVGSGSACTAATLEPSHVLAAMGVLSHGNVRLGLPVGTDPDAVEAFCDVLPGAVARVRAMLGVEDL